MLRVTIDSNVLSRDLDRLHAAAEGFDVEVAPTTVTLRERGQLLIDPDTELASVAADPLSEKRIVCRDATPIVYESALAGEWRAGMACAADENAEPRFDAILRTISNGSLKRQGFDHHTKKQRTQVRDAMILEAHARDRRDVFVTGDARAFINHGRREKLEALCSTRIMTVEEFCAEVATLAPRLR